MKKVKLFESFISEANRGKVHKAAKQGSYPAVIVVVLDGKVIHQEPVSTPEVAPATFNVMQEKYPKALLHLEDKTGKRLFSESLVSEYDTNESVVNEASKDIEKEIKDLEDYQAKLSKKLSTEKKPSIRKNLSKLKDDIVTKKLKLKVKLDKLAKKESKSITEKREDVGKYNTVKKVISKLGRRPSEKDLAKFINDNYYDVTEVERGDDDSKADDKIADLVGVYKFDIDDWEKAWNSVQNESVVTEQVKYSSSNTKEEAAKQATKEFGNLLPKVNKGVEPYEFAVVKTKARNYRLAIKSGSYIAHEFMSGLKGEGILTTDDVKKAVANVIKMNPDEFNEAVVDTCWDGYKLGDPKTKISSKTGKRVNNCVPVNESVVTEASKGNLKKGDKLKFTETGEIIFIIEPKGDGYDFKMASDPREKDHAPKGWFDMMIKRGKLVSESVVTEAAYANATQNELAEYIMNLSNELKYAKANNDKKEIKFIEGDIAEVKAALAKMKNESVVTEGIIYTKDDLVYNKKTKMVNIVRVGNDTYSDVSTDSSGNVPVSHIEKYNPIKNKHQQNAKVSADTEKEITKRGLFNPFKNESVVTEGIFDSIADPIKALHFETDPKTAELMKMELGKKQGETNKKKQIDSAEYSLRRFRKSIKFGDGTYLGVFLPGSYDASVSTLGDGPHKKAVKAVKWNQKKYDQWLEDMSGNGGADNAFDMAQNAKNETGLIDWVKKNFRGEDPLQRIQWDIEAFAESVTNEEIKSYNEKDTLYKQIHDKYAESIKGLKAGKIKKLTDLVSVQRWAMEDEHDTPGHDHKKMSATFKEERKLFKQWMAGDKDVQLKEAVELVESFKKFKDHIASINDGSGSTAEVYFTKGKGYYVVVSGEYDYDFDAKDKKELTKKLKDNEFTNEPFEGSI